MSDEKNSLKYIRSERDRLKQLIHKSICPLCEQELPYKVTAEMIRSVQDLLNRRIDEDLPKMLEALKRCWGRFV